jgi:hypothetical protein
VLEKLRAGLLMELNGISGKIESTHSRKRELDRELATLTLAVANGQLSPPSLTGIA